MMRKSWWNGLKDMIQLSQMNDNLSDEFIRDVLNEYGVGKYIEKPKNVKPREESHKTEGNVDVNYLITTKRGKYFIKFIQENKNFPLYEFSGYLYNYLADRRVPVPRMYKGKQDKYVVNGCVLCEFLEGETQTKWSNKEITSAAKGLAQLHNAVEKIDVPEVVKSQLDDYIRGENVKYCSENVFPKIFKLGLADDIKEEIQMTIGVLERELAGYSQFSKYIIHGDFNEGNAFFKNNKLVGIIDLALRYDTFVYDLAIFIWWFALIWEDKQRLDIEKLKLILQGYSTVRKLIDLERKWLPYLLLRRSFLTFSYPAMELLKGKMDKNQLNENLQKNCVRNRKIREDIYTLS